MNSLLGMIFRGKLFCLSLVGYNSQEGKTTLLSIQLKTANTTKKFKLGRSNPLLVYRLLKADEIMLHCEKG